MKISMADRFWKKVHKTNECWIWTGGKNKQGYGCFYIGNGKHNGAHRVSYELKNRIIPTGLAIDHLCLNKSCVNPDHLEAVTQAENNTRAWNIKRKNRCPKGHLFNKSNTRYQAHGRICIKCKKQKNIEWYQKWKTRLGIHQETPNWQKTKCPSGHPYNRTNTVFYKGSRGCRECQKIHKRNYKIKMRNKKSHTGGPLVPVPG